MIDRLHAWQLAHNAAPEREIYRVDADHARRMGLPTLCQLLSEVDDGSHRYICTDELADRLRKLLSVAVGEANERVRIRLADPTAAWVPGVPEIPRHLLERDESGVRTA